MLCNGSQEIRERQYHNEDPGCEYSMPMNKKQRIRLPQEAEDPNDHATKSKTLDPKIVLHFPCRLYMITGVDRWTDG